MGDNVGKLTLIPHTSYGGKRGISNDLARLDGPMCDKLVGEVMAHQGDDR